MIGYQCPHCTAVVTENLIGRLDPNEATHSILCHECGEMLAHDEWIEVHIIATDRAERKLRGDRVPYPGA